MCKYILYGDECEHLYIFGKVMLKILKKLKGITLNTLNADNTQKEFIYIIKKKGVPEYKIGKSTSPLERIRAISVLANLQIKKVHIFEVLKKDSFESLLHRFFGLEGQQLKGEWFIIKKVNIEQQERGR